LRRNSSIRSNHEIRVPEVRVIGPAGENFGVLPTRDAIAKALELGLDLVEISANANPPVTKITDLGKHMYEESKKQKAVKAKAHIVEIKSLQVRIGTGEHDLELKAKKASEWLTDGHRVKIELFLPGRAKYLDPKFLHERLERIFALLTVPYKIAEKPQKGLKGLTTIIEKGQ
jgi:translation initiation factor IF-3